MTRAHDITTGHVDLYCHDCEGWFSSTRDGDHGWTCDYCGADILCDVCGQTWTESHDEGCSGR